MLNASYDICYLKGKYISSDDAHEFLLKNANYDNGGAGMQLLDDDEIRKRYCEECGK